MTDGFQSMSVGEEQTERIDPFVNKYVAAWRRVAALRRCLVIPPDLKEDEYHDLTPESTVWEHLQSLTALSSRIMMCIIAILFVTIIMIAVSSSSSATVGLVLLIVGMLMVCCLQAIMILYIVYWRRHRLDLSLNRVIQYFGTGVALAVTLMTIRKGLMILLSVLAVSGYDDNNDDEWWLLLRLITTTDNPSAWWIPLFRDFLLIGALEEYLKYCGYMSQTTSRRRPDHSHEDTEALLIASSPNSSTEPSMAVSSGAAITCAMISVATGFAWFENLVHVLFLLLMRRSAQQQPSWTMTILILKSCFPIHSLFAAIQSIGVCARDLEGNRRALILTPSIMFHGLFAYFLIGAATATRNNEEEEKTTSTTPAAAWELLGASMMTVLVGIAYYVYFAGRQRLRLQAIQDNPLLMLDQEEEEGETAAIASHVVAETENEAGCNDAADD